MASNEAEILICVNCGAWHSQRISDGVFFCPSCRVLSDRVLVLRVVFTLPDEAHDWDAELAELWREQGHTVAND